MNKFLIRLKNVGFTELRILLALFIIVAGSWLFIQLAGNVNKGTSDNFDRMIIELIEKGNTIVNQQMLSMAMEDVTALGSGTVIFLLTIALAGYYFFHKDYIAFWLIVIAVAGGTLLSFALKEIFARERPSQIISLISVDSYSFPSGHSMMSAVIYLSLAALIARIQPTRRIKIYVLSLAVILTLLIGISRIYLGVHYPTDVLAGWSIGLVWALICWIAAEFVTRNKSANKIR